MHVHVHTSLGMTSSASEQPWPCAFSD